MKVIKILLDIIMFVIMIILMNTNITGLQIHELLGIGIFVIFIIHKILNFKWIKSISKNFTSKNLNIKTRILFVLDIMLLFFITANVITGILISKTILVNLTVENINDVTVLHKFFAWWSLILIAIHIGFHWNNAIKSLCNKLNINKDHLVIKIVCKILYVLIAISGVISLFVKGVYKQLIPNVQGNNNETEKVMDYEKSKPSDFPQSNTETEKTKKYKNRNKSDSSTSSSLDTQTISLVQTSGGTPTLQEYLSKLTCNGCSKHCILTNPQCGRGVSYQEEKTLEYNELYGNTTSTSSDSNRIPNSNTADTQEDTKNNNTQNEFTASKNNNNIEDITKETFNGTSVLECISIMGLFIGGTYYILELTRKKDK